MNSIVQTYETDIATCKRAGSLAAYGLMDQQIADALLLSKEQVLWAKNTREFQEAHAKALLDKTQMAIDLEEGWDAAEEKALEIILQNLQFNRDAKYALNVAAVANRAKRRTPAEGNRVIDPQNTGGNVILLQMNKTYIQNNQRDDGAAVIDAKKSSGELVEIQQNQEDMPTPKRVTEMLGDASANDLLSGSTNATLDELDRELSNLGVDFKENSN